MRSTAAKKTLWTVGHSTLHLKSFLKLVIEIDLLADIRRFPFSKRFPHFDGDALSRIKAYRWFPELGGRRKGAGERHPAWRVAGFRTYAAYMETEPFRQALAQLESAALEQRTSLLCAEALWWRCHRRLVSDALVSRGWRVLHLPSGKPHELSPMARVERDGTILYDRALPP